MGTMRNLKESFKLFIYNFSGEISYPNSAMYSPSNKLSPVNFNEGVRTPVLQYAHPELGVQPAKLTSSDDLKQKYDDNSYAYDSSRKYYDGGSEMNRVDYYR